MAVDQTVNASIDQLPPNANLQPGMLGVIKNPFNGLTENFNISQILASPTTQNFDWEPDHDGGAGYDIGDVVVRSGKWFRSTIDDNLNDPTTDPATSGWEILTQSPSGFVPWQAGVFPQDLPFVYVNSGTLDEPVVKFYVLASPTRPYVSSNFTTELAAGDWKEVFVSAAGGIELGDLFPDTFFCAPAPYGNDGTAQPGDFTRPYTPAGAVAAASAGKKVSWLPGMYNVSTNLAKIGVTHSTFAGSVFITNDTINNTIFDFNTFGDLAYGVSISSPDFFFTLDADGTKVFKFLDSSSFANQYSIRFGKITILSGVGAVGIQLPLLCQSSSFEGDYQLMAGRAIVGPASGNACTSGGSTIRANIYSESTIEAVEPMFSGMSAYISFKGINAGLLNIAANGQASVNNLMSLSIDQATGCTTEVYQGHYDLTVKGGTLRVYSNCRVTLNGDLDSCIFQPNPNGTVVFRGLMKNVRIINNQAGYLQLEGESENCSYLVAGGGEVCVLLGKHNDFQGDLGGNLDPGIMTIRGEVNMKAGVSIVVNGTRTIKVMRDAIVTGNTGTCLFYIANVVLEISGRVTNLNAAGYILLTASSGGTLKMRAAEFVVGVAGDAIRADTGHTLNVKLLGRSYGNQALGGPGTINYLIGSAADYIQDSDVN